MPLLWGLLSLQKYHLKNLLRLRKRNAKKRSITADYGLTLNTGIGGKISYGERKQIQTTRGAEVRGIRSDDD